MALPPEHINIKRRREEEPVETLYIQSELHQKKRRFTDFIFQRVQPNLGSATGTGGQLGGDQQQQQQQRAVSGFATSPPPTGYQPQGGIGVGGAPVVRVTSPSSAGDGVGRTGSVGASGAGRNVLRTSSSRVSLRSQSRSQSRSRARARGDSPLRRKGSVNQLSGGSSSPLASAGPGASGLRRFHLSRPVGGGIQKKRGGVGPGAGGGGVGDVGRAVLVEKLERGGDFDGLSLKKGGGKSAVDSDVSMLDNDAGVQQSTSPAPARKRPVVNSAEKRWREEQGAASSRAKANLEAGNEKKGKTGKSVRDDPSNWDQDSDQLAQELQEVALEMMMEQARSSAPKREEPSGPTPMSGISSFPKPQLKYQPRNPTRRLHNGAAKHHEEQPDAMETDEPAPASGKNVTGEEEDSDGDYVYDTYIRRPLPVQEQLSDKDAAAAAAASAEKILQASKMPIPIDGDQLSRNIGIVVISAEDEEYWDTYAVEDDSRGGEEKEWDSEDEDSNAEDHPFNDYPDEELASDDEEDDPTAIYRKYRNRGASDDEQDFDEYGDYGDGDDGDFGYYADDVDSDGEISRGGRGVGMGWGY